MRFNLIQTLRFWAALIVMLGHVLIFLSQQAPSVPKEPIEFLSWAGGVWAVSLFFCISGFVITHAAQQVSAGEFLAHRLLRIYPGFLAAVAAVMIVKYTIWRALPEGHLTFAALSLTPQGHITYPLSVEWTLIYEVFFYVVFALLWTKRSNRIVLTGVSIWLACILAAALNRPEWASDRFPTWATILFSARSLPFIFGVYAYFLYDRMTPRLRHLLYLAVPAGAFGIALVGSTEAIMASTTVSVFALLLLAADRAMRKDMASDALLVQYGNYSYGLYLVHIPVITIILATTPLAQRPVLLSITVLVTMSLALGLLFGVAENAMYRRLKTWYATRSKLGWRGVAARGSLSKA